MLEMYQNRHEGRDEIDGGSCVGVVLALLTHWLGGAGGPWVSVLNRDGLQMIPQGALNLESRSFVSGFGCSQRLLIRAAVLFCSGVPCRFVCANITVFFVAYSPH